MNPSSIEVLIARCRFTVDEPENDYARLAESFLIAWVAWEALRTRFLRVVLHQQGWMIKDVDKVLSQRKISSMHDFAKVITAVGMKHPHQWPKASVEAWKMLEKIEQIRHRLIHGFRRIDPEVLKKSTCVVCSLLQCHQWMQDVPLGGDGQHKQRLIGPVLAKRHSSIRHAKRSVIELASLVGIALHNGTSKQVPSLLELERFYLKYPNAIQTP